MCDVRRDAHIGQRVGQALELANLVSLASLSPGACDLVLLAGDLNASPNSLTLRCAIVPCDEMKSCVAFNSQICECYVVYDYD